MGLLELFKFSTALYIEGRGGGPGGGANGLATPNRPGWEEKGKKKN